MLEHCRAIVHNDPSYHVVRHFWEFHEGKSDGFSYFVIDRVELTKRGGDSEGILRIIESWYILRLWTKHPFGINRDEELTVHLNY